MSLLFQQDLLRGFQFKISTVVFITRIIWIYVIVKSNVKYLSLYSLYHCVFILFFRWCTVVIFAPSVSGISRGAYELVSILNRKLYRTCTIPTCCYDLRGEVQDYNNSGFRSPEHNWAEAFPLRGKGVWARRRRRRQHPTIFSWFRERPDAGRPFEWAPHAPHRNAKFDETFSPSVGLALVELGG